MSVLFPWSFRRPGRRAGYVSIRPDPIDHPAIARMSLAELADLPLWPATSAEEPPPDLRPRVEREKVQPAAGRGL